MDLRADPSDLAAGPGRRQGGRVAVSGRSFAGEAASAKSCGCGYDAAARSRLHDRRHLVGYAMESAPESVNGSRNNGDVVGGSAGRRRCLRNHPCRRRPWGDH